MLCTNCKKEHAAFFYTQSINGISTSVALCPNCASKAGVGLNTQEMLSPLFHSFFDIAPQKKVAHDTAKKCGLCALTFGDILSLGKVGCPECYNTFREELRNTIRSIHGAAKHTGLSPKETADSSNGGKGELTEEEKLREQLSEAIKAENYEYAAELRDKIKKIRGDN